MRRTAKATDTAKSDRRSVALVGATLGVLLLLVFAARGVENTRVLLRGSVRSSLEAQEATFRCLERRIEHEVPDAAAVFFTSDSIHMRDHWIQRAVEGSYPRYRVRSRRRDAEFVVTVGAFGEGCRGLHVNIRPAP